MFGSTLELIQRDRALKMRMSVQLIAKHRDEDNVVVSQEAATDIGRLDHGWLHTEIIRRPARKCKQNAMVAGGLTYDLEAAADQDGEDGNGNGDVSNVVVVKQGTGCVLGDNHAGEGGSDAGSQLLRGGVNRKEFSAILRGNG